MVVLSEEQRDVSRDQVVDVPLCIKQGLRDQCTYHKGVDRSRSRRRGTCSILHETRMRKDQRTHAERDSGLE